MIVVPGTMVIAPQPATAITVRARRGFGLDWERGDRHGDVWAGGGVVNGIALDLGRGRKEGIYRCVNMDGSLDWMGIGYGTGCMGLQKMLLGMDGVCLYIMIGRSYTAAKESICIRATSPKH